MRTNPVRRLRDEHPGAGASLNEGLDETLTVKRIGLPDLLARRLSTTYAMENVIGSARVKRWRKRRMMLRCVDGGTRPRASDA